MNKRIRRRLLLTTLLGGGLVATGVGVAIWPLAPEARLKRLLQSRLDYLTIPEPVLDAFIKDFTADIEHERFKHLSTLRYVGQRAAYGQPLFTGYLPIFRFERFVVSSFLLSTDFFREGARTDRPLRYVAYNDPLKVGCSNPFARL
jgi:hypothetical protein